MKTTAVPNNVYSMGIFYLLLTWRALLFIVFSELREVWKVFKAYSPISRIEYVINLSTDGTNFNVFFWWLPS
tara:strand:- start:3364 stop:3579 length:216 start_codon:yes stop_codon:yes gene_type:complete